MTVRLARREARERGEKHYVTGIPCKNGHIANRLVSSCHCVKCAADTAKNWYFAGKEHQRRKANPRRHLWKIAKARAEKRGIEFTITIEDMPEVPEFCPILGIKITEVASGFASRSTGPSLDRVDAGEGYIPGNLQIISFRANVLKGDATFDEIEKLYSWFRRTAN